MKKSMQDEMRELLEHNKRMVNDKKYSNKS